MKFEKVLPALREGKKLKRAYWIDIYIELERGTGLTSDYIVMQRREERFVMEVSTDALLAEDWEII